MSDHGKEPARPSGQTREDALHPVEWAVRTGTTAEIMGRLEARLRQRRRRQWAAGGAATVALLLSVAGWPTRFPASREAAASAPASIVVNAPERRVLPDGSTVELRHGAVIHLVFSTSLRGVVLEHGEAHFEVTKDAQRPFVVQAGAVQARAVGTAFSVHRLPGATEVVVTHGRVAVDREERRPVENEPAVVAAGDVKAKAEPLALLDAGFRAVVESEPETGAAGPRVEQLSPAALDERLAWRVPTLEFSGTPLEDAIPMVNRHGKVRLVLADRRIGRVRLSGVIRADNAATLLRLLQEEHGIRAERQSDGIIVLSRPR